jgi:hypothetical protein
MAWRASLCGEPRSEARKRAPCIAFEVFSLLKEEPSLQSDLSIRFRAMRLSCANTPAEEGLVRILDVVDKAVVTF